MNNLVIDIGNTRIKSALFSGKTMLGENHFESLDQGVEVWATLDFARCMVSSVRFSQEDLEAKLPFPFFFLSHATPLPIHNGYSSPTTLGLDRIASAIGAWELSGKGPVLSIDLGTCITYEYVDGMNRYCGGAISPGLRMRAKAMSAFTAKLPEVELEPRPQDPTGDSTLSCLRAGIWYGVEYELLGQMQAYQAKFPEIKVYICGGDSQSFESLAKDHIFVVPNLVLHGLNCILNHNVE